MRGAVLADTPTKGSEVVDQVDLFVSTITDLESILMSLEERLTRVLKAPTPKVLEKDKEILEDLVPLAQEISAQKKRVKECFYTVESILDRLEV